MMFEPGVLYALAEDQADRAQKAVERLVELDPNNPEAYRMVAAVEAASSGKPA